LKEINGLYLNKETAEEAQRRNQTGKKRGGPEKGGTLRRERERKI